MNFEIEISPSLRLSSITFRRMKKTTHRKSFGLWKALFSEAEKGGENEGRGYGRGVFEAFSKVEASFKGSLIFGLVRLEFRASGEYMKKGIIIVMEKVPFSPFFDIIKKAKEVTKRLLDFCFCCRVCVCVFYDQRPGHLVVLCCMPIGH